MSVAVLENVELAFAGRRVIPDLSLRIGEEDRIGLVGRNGCGKSSLLRILVGQQEPDGGVVRTARSARVGYLPQEIEVGGGRTLIDTVLSSVPGRGQLEERLTEVEDELSRAEEESEQMALAEKLANLHDDLAHFDANYSPHEAHAILAGLGFKPGDAKRDLAELSGGWKMRAMMAALLFQKPDLLMLDEPTNHLDVGTVKWLGDFLARYPSALILVCHDREFLNEQISRVVSYEAEGIRQYAGNYEEYRRLRAEELDVIERRAANVQRHREQNERFIRRFRAQATKARAVQSRVKALEKLGGQDDAPSAREGPSLSFRFRPCERSGQDVVALNGLGHSYGDLHVFSDVDLTAGRGDRIAIIGPNGAGKTTLLKIIAGELSPARGEVKLGYNVKAGYYAQHVSERLDLGSSVFDAVWRASVLDDVTQVRTVLGTFLFSDDEVDKRIGVLSGGEKARVALATLMVDPGNLLLMDEPTNHLDLESSEAQAEALKTFDGTLLFVSHNRSFIKQLATRIWHMNDGGVEEFPGSFDEFLYHLSATRRAGETGGEKTGLPASKDGNKKVAAGASGVSGDKKSGEQGNGKRAQAGGPGGGRDSEPPPVSPREEAKRLRRQEKTLQRQVQRLRKTIAELEVRIGEIETSQEQRSDELSRPEVYEDRERYQRLLGAFTDDANKLEELVARWEHAHASLTELDAETTEARA